MSDTTFSVDDCEITGRDLRPGMGIGGWNMEWTYLHKPTKSMLRFETSGSYPESQHKMHQRAMAALELLVEVYLPMQEQPR